MTNVVHLYDQFYQTDLGSFFPISLALLTSDYTFDRTHSSFFGEVIPFESSGPGYAELTDFFLAVTGATGNHQNWAAVDGDFLPPVFASMTVSNYRYMVGYIGDRPIFCIDTGSASTLTAQPLALSGTVIHVTGP